MAASQARLLTLTARIHDVEYQAQSIQNAKVQLATKEDQVYREYQEALDATSLTFTMMNGAESSTVIANFNNLFSKNAATTGNFSKYVLLGRSGKIVVDQDVYEGYQDFRSIEDSPRNAYFFAMYMMTRDLSDYDDEDFIYELQGWEEDEEMLEENPALYDAYQAVVNIFEEYDLDFEEGEDSIFDEELFDDIDDEDEYDKAINKYHNALDIYRKRLYSQDNAAQIYSYLTEEEPENFNYDEFNYYVNIYNAIQQRGCESIEDYKGFIESSDPATNSEWLTAMIQSGQMSIEKINVDKNGKTTLSGVSPSSDTNIKYTTTTDIDKAALAKAEAKYEHDLKLIDKKDKAFDLDLKKLETERSALTTEYDSVKKVISDNVDRTFGIFS